MKRLFRRSILWLLPLVIVPLGALAVMQYRFLRALEQKSVSAERNSMRSSLELVTADIETRYRMSAMRSLAITESRLVDVQSLGRHFAENKIPGARLYFAFRFREGMSEAGFFDATGVERIPTSAEAEAVKMGYVAWQVAHKLQRVVAQPALQVDERDRDHRLILFPVTDSSLHVIGVTGVVLDPQKSQKFMSAIGTAKLRERHPRGMLALRIAPVLTKAANGREYISQPLSFVFTDWRAGVRDTCASPEEMAAINFRHNALWTGGAFVVLCGAIVLAIGAMFRQARLSQMKSDFVSNVSHELRTPLSSIRVFGEYMRLGRVTKPEKIQEYGEYIEAEGRRLTQLINNILDFSKIESAEKKYRFCEVDVVDLVENTVNAFEVPLREQGFVVSYEGPEVHPPALLIDKDAIGQVLVNLIDNAMKYSGERKEIAVRVTTAANELRIAIRDRGIGIPSLEQKKIFEKFYRVGGALVHDVKGSGLGLAIVKHVVQAHGGRVEVASMPGEGSTFTIVLPLKTSETVRVPATEYA
ncbi:MAG TPA: HAMP domain-containing sensor histidine kinase [Thermoanaerobaculia bacterium]|jgi:signal transduction histidine kinase